LISRHQQAHLFFRTALMAWRNASGCEVVFTLSNRISCNQEVGARMKTQVVIVDGQASVRQMLALVLATEGAYEVVGEGCTGLEGWTLCQRKKPRLLIADLSLAEMTGSELIRRVREAMHEVRVLVYSSSDHAELTRSGLRARPHGFVHKRDSLFTMREALRAVSSGCSFFTPFASNYLADLPQRSAMKAALTQRERVVLQMVAEGLSSKEMAARLAIATKTVEHHRTHLMEKLQVHNVAGLTRIAVREGLVSLD
jgi:DNA-binding NarL/FixJ family response regulator